MRRFPFLAYMVAIRGKAQVLSARLRWRSERFVSASASRGCSYARAVRYARLFGVSSPLLALSALIVLFAWLAQSPAPEISYERSSEVGEEVVVRFYEPITEVEARARFRIEPEVVGELVWLDGDQELHFLPHHGFNPLVTYRVTASRFSPYFAAVKAPIRAFTFTTPAGQGSDQTELPEEVTEGKFIDLNLSTMTLTLFENGAPVATYPVAGKGNPWLKPTREGMFRILSKEELHFSSIYKVWMPYSMRYSGSFYIHGWPYWPNGRLLTSVYSGGCVRMFDNDIKEVFAWAEVGTPLRVHSTPGRVALFSADVIRDGDLVREESSPNVYVVKQIGAKLFKRHAMTTEFATWYPHLSPFWVRVKTVPDGTLTPYRQSRWVYAADDPAAPANRTIYEINAPGRKHVMRCGDFPGDQNVVPEKCDRSWDDYGWDRDELFVVSSRELSSYEDGESLTLPVAPQLAQ